MRFRVPCMVPLEGLRGEASERHWECPRCGKRA